MTGLFLTLLLICMAVNGAPTQGNESPSSTSIHTQNVTTSSIDYQVLGKPHHLFIGRCKPEHKVLHQENIILVNDGKSRILAGIRSNINGPVKITCVKIYDEVPNGEGGYPDFISGGVGTNYIEFSVMTEYGKGFHFYLQIYGLMIDEEKKNENKEKEQQNDTKIRQS